MPMFNGKTGNIYWNDGALNILNGQNWTLDAVVDVAETTSFQDTWKTYLAGVKDWTATVECNAEGALPQIPFTTAGGISGLGEDDATLKAADEMQLELYLVFAAGNYVALYGDAVCIGISHTVDVADVNKLTYSFQGFGTLAVWDHNTTSHPT